MLRYVSTEVYTLVSTCITYTARRTFFTGQLAFDANSANSTPAQPTATITTQPPSPSTIKPVKLDRISVDVEEVDSGKEENVIKSDDESKIESNTEPKTEPKTEPETEPKTDLNNNPELVNFRNQLDSRITDLGNMIESAQTFLTLPEMSQPGTEHINVAVGMAHLLITGKFKQFGGLCDLHYGVKVVTDGVAPPTYGDLQGFWEMIYLTFENIQKEFDSIEAWKNNDWNEPEQKPVTPAAKRTPKSTPSSRPTSANSTKPKKASRGRNSSSALREQIKAARLAKMKENAEADAQNTSSVSGQDLTETPKCSSPEKDFSTGDNATLANSGAESRSVPELVEL